MNRITKTTIQFFLAGALFASFAVTGCNNEADSKAAETPKDSVSSAPASTSTMEAAPVAPAAPDSTHKKDTAKTRPTPGGS